MKNTDIEEQQFIESLKEEYRKREFEKKQLAIEFAEYCVKYALDNINLSYWRIKSIEQLFEQFIKEKYGN